MRGEGRLRDERIDSKKKKRLGISTTETAKKQARVCVNHRPRTWKESLKKEGAITCTCEVVRLRRKKGVSKEGGGPGGRTGWQTVNYLIEKEPENQ